MSDRLDIVNQRVEQSEMKLTDMAKMLGIGRTTLYNWLSNPEIDRDKIARIGYVIQHDFTLDFPDMKGFSFYHNEKLVIVGDQATAYTNPGADGVADRDKESIADLKNEMKQLHRKFDILLDTVNRILKAQELK